MFSFILVAQVMGLSAMGVGKIAKPMLWFKALAFWFRSQLTEDIVRQGLDPNQAEENWGFHSDPSHDYIPSAIVSRLVQLQCGEHIAAVADLKWLCVDYYLTPTESFLWERKVRYIIGKRIGKTFEDVPVDMKLLQKYSEERLKGITGKNPST